MLKQDRWNSFCTRTLPALAQPLISHNTESEIHLSVCKNSFVSCFLHLVGLQSFFRTSFNHIYNVEMCPRTIIFKSTLSYKRFRHEIVIERYVYTYIVLCNYIMQYCFALLIQSDYELAFPRKERASLLRVHTMPECLVFAKDYWGREVWIDRSLWLHRKQCPYIFTFLIVDYKRWCWCVLLISEIVT